jgi:hypothetical protein
MKRIAVPAERPRDEAVVGGVIDGAVEHAIEPQQSRLLVQLVLVLAALGNFDDDRKPVGDDGLVDVTVVPGVHGWILTNDE